MMPVDPNVTFGIAPPHYRLPAATRLGVVTLQVSSLERSVAYYHTVIGLDVMHRDAQSATLGVAGDGSALIVLRERTGVRPVPPSGRLGLYHVAILLPDRASLGRFLRHVTERQEPVGMSDHYVSEALYLTDPDGLGLEVYADRDRTTWQVTAGQLAMGSVPLNTPDLAAAARNVPWTGAPRGTCIGHMHLHVGTISAASEFYHNVLGFDKTVWEYPGALFMSAGGYHHHLGTNTWARQAIAAPEDEARLMSWTVIVPTRNDVQAIIDSCTRHGVAVLPPVQPPVNGNSAVATEPDSFTPVRIADPWGTVVCVHAGENHNG